MELDRRGRPEDIQRVPPMVRWQSGDVADCKSAYAGSIPARTSKALKSPARRDAHGAAEFVSGVTELFQSDIKTIFVAGAMRSQAQIDADTRSTTPDQS
jgi:hypothetical protein